MIPAMPVQPLIFSLPPTQPPIARITPLTILITSNYVPSTMSIFFTFNRTLSFFLFFCSYSDFPLYPA